MKIKTYTSEFDKVIGDFLTQKRQERNYSIQNVADLLNINVNTYYCYEKATRSLPINVFKKVCILYNVDFYKTFEQLDKLSERKK